MTTVIIEDIKHEADLIKKLLNMYFPQITILGMADNVDEGIQLITNNKPNFVLMDIEIRGGTSYDILSKIHERQSKIEFEVIFITGNQRFDYATMAFSYSALDFIAKPIDSEKFKAAIAKAMQKNNSNRYLEQIELFLELVKSPDNKNSKMAIHKFAGEIEFIEINNLLYIEADKEISNFVFKDGSNIKSSKNMGQYEQLLTIQHNFFPISNSILINYAELKKYHHNDKSVTMSNGTRLVASRRGGKDLKDHIAKIEVETPKNKFSSLFKRLFG